MIGIFDSGYGGLSILKEIVKELPEYDYLYLGDNLRYPYGGRSQEAIYNFTEKGVDFLFEHGCELIIIACNTASAKALRSLQRGYLIDKFGENSTKRILGVVRPLAEDVAGKTKKNKVGLIATQSTVDSKVYETELEKLNPKIELFKVAAPLIVPLVEEGWIKRKETRMIVKYYLRDLKNKKIDTLILGCTHYPILYSLFTELMGKSAAVPHPGKVVARSLKDYLRRHKEIDDKLSQKSKRIFYTTDYPEKFDRLGKIIFGSTIKSKKITL